MSTVHTRNAQCVYYLFKTGQTPHVERDQELILLLCFTGGGFSNA